MLLNEGKRDEQLAVFLPLFEQRGIPMNVSKLKQLLLAKFVNEASIHNLSLGSNFFLCGVATYYFRGELTENKELGIFSGQPDDFNSLTCAKLNKVIELARRDLLYFHYHNEDVDEKQLFVFPSVSSLFDFYRIDDKSFNLLQNFENENYDENDKSCGQNYTYEIMYNHQQCKQFYEDTYPGSWCITYGQNHYDNYINYFKEFGGIHYVVFKRNDYKEVPRVVGENYPCDDYGNSLICVLQRNNCPEPTYITSRWNHGGHDSPTCEADHAYSTEEFFKTVGCTDELLKKIYAEWYKHYQEYQEDTETKNSRVLEKYQYCYYLLGGGAKPESIFTDISYFENNGQNFNKSVCQVSVDNGRTWCMSFRGKLECDCISYGDGKFDAINVNSCQIITEYLTSSGNNSIIFNKKFNKVLTGLVVFNLTYTGDLNSFNMHAVNTQFYEYMSSQNFILLQDDNNVLSFYNPLKNKYFVFPDGSTEFIDARLVSNSCTDKYDVDNEEYRNCRYEDNGCSILCFHNHNVVNGQGVNKSFYYDLETQSFLSPNSLIVHCAKNREILFVYKKFMGVRDFNLNSCFVVDTKTREFVETINGNAFFKNIMLTADGVIVCSLKNETRTICYDLETQEVIRNENNEPINASSDYSKICNHLLVISSLNNDSELFIYDTLNRKFIGEVDDCYSICFNVGFSKEGLYDMQNNKLIAKYPTQVVENYLRKFKKLI